MNVPGRGDEEQTNRRMPVSGLQNRQDAESAADVRDLPARLAMAQTTRRPSGAEAAGVLVVERNDAVRVAFAAMLRALGHAVEAVPDGGSARGMLVKREFDVVLCDEASAERVGRSPEVAQANGDTIVILVANPHSYDTATLAADSGATEILHLPCNQGELGVTIQRSLTRRMLQRRHAQRFRAALETSSESVLDALLTALNTRDTETEGHAERVTAYTMELAGALRLPAAQTYHIERGALLHDIGKIGVPDQVLHKPGDLSDAEREEMRKHPVIGYQMCAKVDRLKQAAAVVLRHHERWDGGGYPDGLAGDAIPIGARVFSVADALDAMTAPRPYRKPVPFAEARAEIVQCAGRQFDPAVVHAFLSVPEARWRFIQENAAR